MSGISVMALALSCGKFDLRLSACTRPGQNEKLKDES